MITLRTLKNLKENEGLTLKDGKPISYSVGFQVATEGVECTCPKIALQYIKQYQGNCGVWLSGGVFYIDNSYHITNKQIAITIGKVKNQKSIYDWENDELIWL